MGLTILIGAAVALAGPVARATGLRPPEFLLVPAGVLLLLFLGACTAASLAGRRRRFFPGSIRWPEYDDLMLLAAARYVFSPLFGYCAAGIIAMRIPAAPNTRGWAALALFLALVPALDRLWVRIQRIWRGGASAEDLAALRNPETADGARLIRLLGAFEHASDAARALGRTGRGNVPLLVGALRDPDPRVRDGAALALERLEADAVTAVPALLKSLEDEVEFVRERALNALGAIVRGDERITGIFLGLMRSEDDGLRAAALDALAKSSAEDPRTIPALLDVARNDRKPWVAGAAVWRIGRIGRAAAAAVPDLTLLLAREDDRLVADAAEAIDRITGSKPVLPGDRLARISEPPPVSFEDLRRLLAKGRNVGPSLGKVARTITRGYPASLEIFASYFERLDPDERAGAIRLLRPHAVAAGPVLLGPIRRGWLRFRDRIRFSTGGLKPVRRLAARCIGRCGPAAAPALEEALTRDGWNHDAAAELLRMQPRSRIAVDGLRSILVEGDSHRRREAARILGLHADADPGVVESLTATGRDPEPGVRSAGAEALGRLFARVGGTPSIDPALFEDPAEDVRRSALEAVGLAGARDPRVVDGVLLLLDDPKAGVRETAAKALGAVGTPSPRTLAALEKAESDGRHAVRDAAREARRRLTSTPSSDRS